MRVNHFGQNSTVVYREKFFRLNPEFSVLRSQLKSYKYIGGTIEANLFGAENNFDEIHFEWFERIKHQRYFTAAMTQFPISMSLNNFIVEPLKMDLV